MAVWSSSKTDERTVICHLCNSTKWDAGGMWWGGRMSGRRKRSNWGRGGNKVTSPLFSPSFPWVLTVLVWSVWRHVRSQCQDVRGFSVETFRERGERDAEIEVCLHTEKCRKQHVNASPFPPSLLQSFKTISESFGIAQKGGNQPLSVLLLISYDGWAHFKHRIRPQITTYMEK